MFPHITDGICVVPPRSAIASCAAIILLTVVVKVTCRVSSAPVLPPTAGSGKALDAQCLPNPETCCRLTSNRDRRTHSTPCLWRFLLVWRHSSGSQPLHKEKTPHRGRQLSREHEVSFVGNYSRTDRTSSALHTTCCPSHRGASASRRDHFVRTRRKCLPSPHNDSPHSSVWLLSYI